MRFQALVTAVVVTGAVADAGVEAARQEGRTALDVFGARDQTHPVLTAGASSGFHSLSTRRTTYLQASYGNPSTRLSRREEDSDDSDDDDDDDNDDDDDDDRGGGDGDDHDDADSKGDDKQHGPNTAAIAGGVVGGVVLVLVLLFLLFWFKFRPRRQRRRRQRREPERKGDEEAGVREIPAVAAVDTGGNRGAYRAVPDDEQPPHYQQVVAARAPSPPRGTPSSPAELPSPVDGRAAIPVDGREPSFLPVALEPDYPKGGRASYQVIHPGRPSSPVF
ncbi:hypothetical protein F4802DRAFT_222627 [Xylaria palmicola]|nr:hypothetical protein F4802DRAFT_222627 [Xylaria palmicola]